MRSINWYIEEAKTRTGIKSDRKLAEMVGLAPNATFFWKSGRAFPSDEAMFKLAKIAGINPLVGLIDLNIWRSNGATQKAYQEIQKGIKVTSVFVGITGLLTLLPSLAHAASDLTILAPSGDSVALTALYIITSLLYHRTGRPSGVIEVASGIYVCSK